VVNAAPPHPSTSAGDLYRLTVDLAQGAANEVRAAVGGRLDVEAKSTATDLVTEVDRAVEHWLVQRLAAVRPDDDIVAEEGSGRETGSGTRWYLDPIDGTVNFVLGLPQFAVSVAVEVDGDVRAGAVANPVSGELFSAASGAGAWLGDRRLHGPRHVPVSRAVVGTGFGYDAERRARQIAVAAQLLPRVADIRRLGAASLDLCFVAAGRLDAYFEAGLNPWDWAAGALIAREAGCYVGGLHDEPPAPRMTVACGPAAKADFLAALRDLRADEVL
jgi:myo-inositol-1(or 4)-monophosphatase